MQNSLILKWMDGQNEQLNLANLHLIIQLLVSLDALELELDLYASQQNIV